NPAFSFLALIAILFSISVQEKELTDSINSLQKQEAILQLQAFETSFFNLLNLLRKRRQEFGNKESRTYAEIFGLKMRRKRKELSKLPKLRAHAEACRFLKSEMKDTSFALAGQFVLIVKTIRSAPLSEERR